MKSKKQGVVEQEFTLDLSNVGAMAKKKKKSNAPVKAVEPPEEQPAPRKTEPERVGESKPIKTEKQRAVPKQSKKKHLRLVVSQNDANAFEGLFKRFVEETETYWVNTSRVHILSLGTLYLQQKYKKEGKYHIAPEDFMKFVSRKGNRPKTEESTIRKTDPIPMFFEVDPELFQAYYDIIYSFLLVNGDVHNRSYSASFFFRDFLDLLENSFKSFCGYGRKFTK